GAAPLRASRFIRRYDAGLLLLNLVFLLCIVFLPVPTEAIGRFPGQQASVVFYAICLAIAGVMSSSIWLYAAHGRRLIDKGLDPLIVRYIRLRGLVPVAVALVSIAVSFISPLASELLLFLAFFNMALLGRIYWRFVESRRGTAPKRRGPESSPLRRRGRS